MIIERGGKITTNTIATMRGTMIVSEVDNGRPFEIMMIVVDIQPTSSTTGISMRIDVVAPRALEGVVSLQDQQ